MTYENIRKNGRSVLSLVMKSNKTVETAIYKFVTSVLDNDDYLGLESFEEVYNRCVYQIYGDFISNNKPKDIILSVKSGELDWNHNMYSTIKKEIYEQDDFIVNPFEVHEGVLTCNKCGENRVFTYQKQHRGGDEPMTTYAECSNRKCKSKWTYSG